MITVTPQRAAAFRRKIFSFYRKHGRKLWFRTTTDPYRITVSEIMLQQTQVERVTEKYAAWIRRWENWESLARATNREVLAMWSGLGYNRRALYLKQLAHVVVEQYGGELPADAATLKKLPGIGEYTANAILIFAFDKRLAAVDTNVRKVLLHEFNLPPTTSAEEIKALATRLLPRKNVKEWHHALMDYARLALKTSRKSTPSSSHRTPFHGSRRQIRGEIIRRLTRAPFLTVTELVRTTGWRRSDIKQAVRSLQQDKMIKVTKERISLAEEEPKEKKKTRKRTALNAGN